MKQNYKKVITTWFTALLCGVSAVAQTDNIVLHYTFDDVSGTSVSDASSSGITATLKNQAKVEEMGKYHVLNLGSSNGYLDMTSKAGNLVKGLEDYTLSINYRVDESSSLSEAGYFLWAFSVLDANVQDNGPYTGYRLNAQRFAVSTGGWGNETGIEIGREANKGVWQNVIYVQSGSVGKLYINGALAGTNQNVATCKSIFTSTPVYNWIGRSPFATDQNLKNTLVADFRVYNTAISDEELKTLAATAKDLEYEYNYGTPGDFEAFRAEIAKCEEFINSASAGEYLQNALDELQDEITIANSVANAGHVSQTLLDKYIVKMHNALNAVKNTKDFEMGTPSAFAQADHGFIHPGGLHTQADFDRVKKLLAEGDPVITAAWNVLCTNGNAQSGVQTWPVETIIRGGGSGQNYMNACRGAAMAYQNALRWKIDGNTANADAAVRVLMAWARGNKYVSGDTNMSLASGLTGYQFAQAAELMRDYEGWSREDFEEFKKYMLVTWYPVACDFLRRRHDTWANWRNASLGQRPGHYWSNWGLCNTLFLMELGILCDDVHIYNQGVSFYKYDHVGTFKDRSKETVIANDGLNEFIGNLVPVVLPDDRGPFGYLGQMQESGRDQGHALMALGLAVDICKVALNQGDDLYAYMDDRLAAGIEHVAAFNFGGVAGEDLPWIMYNYADCRGRLYQGWGQGGPNGGGLGGWRPYWDRIIGYYEGVRGVKMQYSEIAAKLVRGAGGADGGGGHYGETSGGYDHLGFSTLMDYRPTMASKENAPVILSGKIVYNGETLDQTNLGGLKYTYRVEKTKAIQPGSTVTLMPQLPEGVTDNGSWKWSTGETTKDITITADHSYIYRVSYTADNGTVSQQSFAIAVAGDCCADFMRPEITVDGIIYADTVQTVLYGNSVILYAGNSTGWTDDYKWSNGVTNNLIVVPNITSDRTYTVNYTNQGGNTVQTRFHLKMKYGEPHITVNDAETMIGTDVMVKQGQTVELQLIIPSVYGGGEWKWSDGSNGSTLRLEDIKTSGEYTVEYVYSETETMKETFRVLVSETKDRLLDAGNYMIRHIGTDTYLTNPGEGINSSAVLAAKKGEIDASQVWRINRTTALARYDFISMLDSTYLNKDGKFVARTINPYRIQAAVGTNYVAIHNSGTSGKIYWLVDNDGTLIFNGEETLTGFPFEIIPVDYDPVGIENITDGSINVVNVEYYTLSGIKIPEPQKGTVLRKRTFADGTVKTDKILVK